MTKNCSHKYDQSSYRYCRRATRCSLRPGLFSLKALIAKKHLKPIAELRHKLEPVQFYVGFKTLIIIIIFRIINQSISSF